MVGATRIDDLTDSVRSSVAGMQRLEWTADVPLPDTTRPEDVVDGLDDGRTVRGSLRHLMEVNSNPRLVSLLSASAGNGALMACI